MNETDLFDISCLTALSEKFCSFAGSRQRDCIHQSQSPSIRLLCVISLNARLAATTASTLNTNVMLEDSMCLHPLQCDNAPHVGIQVWNRKTPYGASLIGHHVREVQNLPYSKRASPRCECFRGNSIFLTPVSCLCRKSILCE